MYKRINFNNGAPKNLEKYKCSEANGSFKREAWRMEWHMRNIKFEDVFGEFNAFFEVILGIFEPFSSVLLAS